MIKQVDYNSRVSNILMDSCFAAIDAMLILNTDNIAYMSGFLGSNGYLLLTKKTKYLFTDSRYIRYAKESCPEWIVKPIGREFSFLSELLLESKIVKLGYESRSISHHDFLNLTNNNPNVYLSEIDGVIEKLRSVKDEIEIEYLHRACRIADSAMTKLIPQIIPGITEFELSLKLEHYLRDYGSEKIPFDVIIGAGLNSALPHHKPGDTMLAQGDNVVIDMGATVKGYRSDISRTVRIGPPDDRYEEIYGVVLEAQSFAQSNIAMNMIAADLDDIARSVITKHGYGEYFIHGLGHGLGLQVHEYPMIIPNSTDLLLEGSVFTLEPGIYIPGWGGIRIEDVVSLTSDGVVSLTSAEKPMYS